MARPFRRVLPPLRRCDHEALVLDGARAQQHLPVVPPGLAREGARHEQEARTARALRPVQLREAQVVADREADAAERRLGDHDLRARRDVGRLLIASAALRAEIARRFRAVEGERAVLLLTDPSGRPVSGNLGAWPAGLAADGRWQIISLYRVGRDEPEPMGVIPIRLKDNTQLLVGMVVSNSLQLTRIYEEALTAAFAISLVLALGSAIMLGRILARQVSDIAETANDVAVGALDRRVPTDGSGDAFDRLGQSINAMLERIDALVTQLRMMTDGLAHDLKSPVTRLISVVEQASAQTADDTALDAMEKVHHEAQTLRSILTTALLIILTEA